MTKYAVGIDFGTESGRAVLVNAADGGANATAGHSSIIGLIDQRLPEPGEMHDF
ncbi:MAG: hypothetical protein AB2L21_05825 [Anaerolineaceae bacterium]